VYVCLIFSRFSVYNSPALPYLVGLPLPLYAFSVCDTANHKTSGKNFYMVTTEGPRPLLSGSAGGCVRSNLHGWLKDLLAGRKQVVSVNGNFSAWTESVDFHKALQCYLLGPSLIWSQQVLCLNLLLIGRQTAGTSIIGEMTHVASLKFSGGGIHL